MSIRTLIASSLIAGATLVGTAVTAAADPPNCTRLRLGGDPASFHAARTSSANGWVAS